MVQLITNFLNDKVLGEGVHYTCIAYISIDSVMRIEKKLSTSLFRKINIK